MPLIPSSMSDETLNAMSDTDFERLVVVPGERLVRDLIAMCASWRDDNQAFLDECYDGITIEQARELWHTKARREAVQNEYRNWYHIRRELDIAF